MPIPRSKAKFPRHVKHLFKVRNSRGSINYAVSCRISDFTRPPNDWLMTVAVRDRIGCELGARWFSNLMPLRMRRMLQQPFSITEPRQACEWLDRGMDGKLLVLVRNSLDGSLIAPLLGVASSRFFQAKPHACLLYKGIAVRCKKRRIPARSHYFAVPWTRRNSDFELRQIRFPADAAWLLAGFPM